MADQPPSLDPGELIATSGAALTAKLSEIARRAVADALAGGDHPSVAEVVGVLEGVTASLGPALAAAIADALPGIAEEAITRASAEIADAREASGKPFPPVEPPAGGDYGGWSATVAAAIIASLTKTAETASTPEAAVSTVIDSDLSGHVSVMADTASARAVNDAREATFKANSDIVKKLHYTAVRDEKTSQGCRHLDGVDFNIWANNIPRPPLHNGCRSFLRPITGIKRKAGATQKEIDRQNWAIFRRLEREHKAAEGRADPETLELRFALPGDDAATFSGIASAPGLDSYQTEFAAGAFAASITEQRASGRPLPLLLHHNPERPCGVVTDLSETAEGLRIAGHFITETDDGREARALAKSGAVGLSVGFKRLADRPRSGGGRTITQARLAEISVVAIPSNSRTRFLDVRSTAAPDADLPHHDGVHQMTTAAAASENATETTAETRAAAGALDAQLAALSTSIAEHRQRMDKLEARASRVGIAGAEQRDESAEIETRAFTSFVRSGREGMPADEVRSLQVSTDSAGGYLVPTDFLREIIKNLVLWSPVRSIARVSQASGSEIVLPRRSGTLTAQWTAETAARSGTQPTYAQNKLNVYEVGCYVDVSNQLLEDSAFDLASELSQDLAEEFGRAEGAAFIAGDGTGKPKGLLEETLTTVNSGAAAAITADGLIDLYHSLPSFYAQNAVWGMNRATIGAVRKLKDTSGRYLWTEPLSEGNSPTILGCKVVELPDMPSIAAGETPVVFGDFSQGFRIFDRINMAILRDPFSVQTSGLVRFHARRRVAGGVTKAEAFRLLKIAAS